MIDDEPGLRVIRIYSNGKDHYFQLSSDGTCDCGRCEYEAAIAKAVGRSRVLVRHVVPELTLWGPERMPNPTLLIDLEQFSWEEKHRVFSAIGKVLDIPGELIGRACLTKADGTIPIDANDSIIEVVMCDDPATNTNVVDHSMMKAPGFENAGLN
jgi:hypothetical protein